MNGANEARYCDACKKMVRGPTRKGPHELPYPFYVRDGAGIHERDVSEACDDCWRRHQQLAPEGDALFRRAHPVEDACAALAERDISARIEASSVLRRLRDPRSVGPLIDAIQTEMRHAGEQYLLERQHLISDLMITLATVGGAEAERYLVTLLHDPRTWLPVFRDNYYDLVPATDWVTRALSTLGDTVMLRALLDLLAEHRPANLRRGAAEELNRLANGLGLTTEAGRDMLVQGLRSVLDDEDQVVRSNAARGLQKLRKR